MTTDCSSCKRVFDISKSKRTRRASYVPEAEDNVTDAARPAEGSDEGQTVVEGTNNGHVKLKQFIKVNGLKQDTLSSGEKDQGRALLSQHFAQEKQLQLVIKQPEGGPQTVKFKRIVKRYVKALSHLVSSKRGDHLEKPVLRLTM